MKKTATLLMVWLIAAVGARADELVIANLNVTPGATAELPVGFRFDNDGEVSSYQFTIMLPQGIATIHDANGRIEVEVGDCYDMTHIVLNNHSEETNEDIFACLSTDSEPLIGTQGTFVTMSIETENTLSEGAVLTAKATNIVYVRTDGTKEKLPDVVFTINVTGNVPTAIHQAGAGSRQNPMYNLGGQQVESVEKGIYIQNGVKKAKR